MKPVLVLQHEHQDGPAYLLQWLRERGIAADVRNTQAGDAYPASVDDHAALAILGGSMSANDPLPSLRDAERLILDAMARQRPVIGHCLGGQLMARALGARVAASPAPEIGWSTIDVHAHDAAVDWFGAAGPVTVFQWHFEAFDLPAGAVPLAGSAACRHQAFAIGPHLAMQFHVELDAEKLQRWADEVDPALAARHATVQAREAMRAGAEGLLRAQQALADRLYARWWAAALPPR
ncbi:type 1 glutamine amidotransferase [Calidifontimicrobium sp. SYSU G02091]|uniref:type 1 glutamine amidotransferase n=1 Tax=Calidifontimicrobium sp. SYSU G02091 TaxID=2926421 RepID=UPI001F53851C|nr:type 1 glutamine amidotransferase [Calidifontimicrobium sp. SYSU G02091]MCI1192070.1 type 1 glutamine amidotransferase [Calidifontimicrobium sp. SYSU G02091]